VKAYEAIVKGENIPEPSIPESFKVLLKEMQALALDVNVISERGGEIEVRDEDDELLRAAEELGIDLTPGSLRATPREVEAGEVEAGAALLDGDREVDVPTDEVLAEVKSEDDLQAEADEDVDNLDDDEVEEEAEEELEAELASSTEADE
jgi:DNA-directed RNA polymerase subunit beta